MGPSARAEPLLAGRFAADPLWRVETDSARYSLRGWDPRFRQQAEQGQRYVEYVASRYALPLPVPLPKANGVACLVEADGLLWELAPWLPGEAATAGQAKQLTSACRALAELHLASRDLACPPTAKPVASYLDRLQRLEGELAGGSLSQASLSRMTTEWQPDWPDTTQALRRATTRVAGQLQNQLNTNAGQQWVWGDAWVSNFLFGGTEVAALVDFAAVRVDTPLADLARLLGSLTDLGSADWHAGIEAYAQVAPLADSHRQLTVALHRAATVLSMANWARWLSVDARRFPDPVAAQGRFDHFARRLAQLLGFPESAP